METEKEIFPDYARDIKINFQNLLTGDGSPGLTQTQAAGSALAAAYASKSPEAVRLVFETAGSALTPEQVKGIKTSASVMAMTNIYYRFLHLVNDGEYAAMPAKLRMTAIGNPGIEKTDFEIYSLAVSAVNGCGYCVESHAKKLAGSGVPKEGVQSAARIAAVVHAAAQAFFIEKAAL